MTEPQTGIEEAVAKAGNMSILARAMDPPVSQQAVQQWVKNGYVPRNRVELIARLYGVDSMRLFEPSIVAAMII